jgi:hypothetical protein
MATAILTFKVTANGSPIEGATWLLGSPINKRLTTDANGEATVTVDQLLVGRVMGEVRRDAGNGSSVSVDIDASVDSVIEWDGNSFTKAAAVVDLAHAKAVKHSQIDARTAEIIGQGFSHGGSTFSLSENAQRNWIGGEVGKNNLTFPMAVSTKDEGEYSIANATEYTTMYLTAVATTKSVIDSGRTLKKSVNAATTVAEVDAVVDNR